MSQLPLQNVAGRKKEKKACKKMCALVWHVSRKWVVLFIYFLTVEILEELFGNLANPLGDACPLLW